MEILRLSWRLLRLGLNLIVLSVQVLSLAIKDAGEAERLFSKMGKFARVPTPEEYAAGYELERDTLDEADRLFRNSENKALK